MRNIRSRNSSYSSPVSVVLAFLNQFNNDMSTIFRSLVLVLFWVFALGQVVTKNVKIVEGIDKLSSLDDGGLESVEADAVSGPESLYFLNGLCFMKSIDRFEYNVCPFQNVTQRIVTGNYPTILGVWGNWIHESNSVGNDNLKPYVSMNFINGKSCGESKVDTKLLFQCEHDGDFDIIGVDDSTFCSYTIKLGVPIACSLFEM